jgi:predicted DNA-binding transcriptional regulator YafY
VARANNPYTGAQRLVKLYERLQTGQPLRPVEYAQEMGVRRQTVYYQLAMLSSCGIPVVNCGYGTWTLEEFAEKLEKINGLY